MSTLDFTFLTVVYLSGSQNPYFPAFLLSKVPSSVSLVSVSEVQLTRPLRLT